MVTHVLNPSILEAEAGSSLSSTRAWPAKQVSGQPGLYRKTLSENKLNAVSKEVEITTLLFLLENTFNTLLLGLANL